MQRYEGTETGDLQPGETGVAVSGGAGDDYGRRTDPQVFGVDVESLLSIIYENKEAYETRI
jgi:hypothetical protein